MTAPHEYQLLANCQLSSALSQGTVSRQRDWNLEQHVVLRGGGGGIGLAGAEVGELGVDLACTVIEPLQKRCPHGHGQLPLPLTANRSKAPS